MFKGFCLESGAEKTVTEAAQWDAFLSTRASCQKTGKLVSHFMFGHWKCIITTVGAVSIPLPGSNNLDFESAVVKMGVTFLVSLDVVKTFMMVFDLQRGIRH